MVLDVGCALIGQFRPSAVRVMVTPVGPMQPVNEIDVIWPTGFVPLLVGTIVAVDAEQVMTIPDLVSVNCRLPADDQVTEADAAPVQAIADTAATMAHAATITLSRFMVAASRILRFEHLPRVRRLLPVSSRPLSARCHPDADGPARLRLR
jgi:hypothetical protein